MRTVSVIAVLIWALALAAPVAAQTSDMPRKLWAEYPLVQKIERTQSNAGRPSAIGPLLPPDAATAPGVQPGSRPWLALGFVAAMVALFAVAAAPVAVAGLRVIGEGARSLPGRRARPTRTRDPKPVRLREHRAHPRASATRRPTHYYVVRQNRFLRSRFDVVKGEHGEEFTRMASSRSFWRVGSERREETADVAWHELREDLRAGGWELSGHRSDFWVPLRRIDDGTSPLQPTIDAYTLASDDPDAA
jgi:hypothetical protein